jgi:hypothetical protein
MDEKDGLSVSILRYICLAGKAERFSPLKTRPKLNQNSTNKENTVASFCGKCGAEVSSDKQFCTVCGAPVAAYTPVAPAAYTPVVAPAQPVAAPAQPAAYTPVAASAQPAASAPQFAPPSKSGPSALKIILIIVLVLVGLGILGAGAFGFMVWRIAHSIHVSGTGANNGQVYVNVPGTSITANTEETFTAADLGTDIYPGATSGKGSMRMNIAGTSMVSAVFVTPDPKDQVVSFYKNRFGTDASVFDSASSAMISVQKGKQESVMVTVTVSPEQYDGKTQIHITHTTKN